MLTVVDHRWRNSNNRPELVEWPSGVDGCLPALATEYRVEIVQVNRFAVEPYSCS